MDDLPVMLNAGELARLVRVNPKTVARWCTQGRLSAIVTPGGQRRFPLSVVLAMLAEMGLDEQAAIEAVRAIG